MNEIYVICWTSVRWPNYKWRYYKTRAGFDRSWQEALKETSKYNSFHHNPFDYQEIIGYGADINNSLKEIIRSQ